MRNQEPDNIQEWHINPLPFQDNATWHHTSSHILTVLILSGLVAIYDPVLSLLPTLWLQIVVCAVVITVLFSLIDLLCLTFSKPSPITKDQYEMYPRKPLGWFESLQQKLSLRNLQSKVKDIFVFIGMSDAILYTMYTAFGNVLVGNVGLALVSLVGLMLFRMGQSYIMVKGYTRDTAEKKFELSLPMQAVLFGVSCLVVWSVGYTFTAGSWAKSMNDFSGFLKLFPSWEPYWLVFCTIVAVMIVFSVLTNFFRVYNIGKEAYKYLAEVYAEDEEAIQSDELDVREYKKLSRSSNPTSMRQPSERLKLPMNENDIDKIYQFDRSLEALDKDILDQLKQYDRRGLQGAVRLVGTVLTTLIVLAPIGLFVAPTPFVIGAFATLAILNVIIFEQIASKIQSVYGGDVKIENLSGSDTIRVSFSDYGHLIEIVKQDQDKPERQIIMTYRKQAGNFTCVSVREQTLATATVKKLMQDACMGYDARDAREDYKKIQTQIAALVQWVDRLHEPKDSSNPTSSMHSRLVAMYHLLGYEPRHWDDVTRQHFRAKMIELSNDPPMFKTDDQPIDALIQRLQDNGLVITDFDRLQYQEQWYAFCTQAHAMGLGQVKDDVPQLGNALSLDPSKIEAMQNVLAQIVEKAQDAQHQYATRCVDQLMERVASSHSKHVTHDKLKNIKMKIDAFFTEVSDIQDERWIDRLLQFSNDLQGKTSATETQRPNQRKILMSTITNPGCDTNARSNQVKPQSIDDCFDRIAENNLRYLQVLQLLFNLRDRRENAKYFVETVMKHHQAMYPHDVSHDDRFKQLQALVSQASINAQDVDWKAKLKSLQSDMGDTEFDELMNVVDYPCQDNQRYAQIAQVLFGQKQLPPTISELLSQPIDSRWCDRNLRLTFEGGVIHKILGFQLSKHECSEQKDIIGITLGKFRDRFRNLRQSLLLAFETLGKSTTEHQHAYLKKGQKWFLSAFQDDVDLKAVLLNDHQDVPAKNLSQHSTIHLHKKDGYAVWKHNGHTFACCNLNEMETYNCIPLEIQSTKSGSWTRGLHQFIQQHILQHLVKIDDHKSWLHRWAYCPQIEPITCFGDKITSMCSSECGQRLEIRTNGHACLVVDIGESCDQGNLFKVGLNAV